MSSSCVTPQLQIPLDEKQDNEKSDVATEKSPHVGNENTMNSDIIPSEVVIPNDVNPEVMKMTTASKEMISVANEAIKVVATASKEIIPVANEVMKIVTASEEMIPVANEVMKMTTASEEIIPVANEVMKIATASKELIPVANEVIAETPQCTNNDSINKSKEIDFEVEEEDRLQEKLKLKKSYVKRENKKV